MRLNLCNFIILCVLISCIECNENNLKNEEKDKTTQDDSTIEKNYHKNEDKKEHDNNELKSGAVLSLPNLPESEPNEEAVNTKLYTISELKETLKNIREDDLSTSPEEIEKIKHRFKKYQEIKDELSELNLFPRSDSEIMKELSEKFEEVKSDDEIFTILEDFDYLVHQYDNAQEFVNLNGFKEIIYHCLNSTNPKIRADALKLMGSAVQHNAKVQIHALETDAVNILLKVLAIDSEYSVRLRAVFALSSLLRRFPLAQLKFVENGGLIVFSNLFDKPHDIKIQLKILTVLNDLLLEHDHALNYSKSLGSFEEKSNQYGMVNLKEHLKGDGWCEKVENVLKNVILVDENDHDSLQRCLEFMNSISDICIDDYSQIPLEFLKKLRKMYDVLVFSEQADDFGTEYYLEMRNLCDEIIEKIIVRKRKNEL